MWRHSSKLLHSIIEIESRICAVDSRSGQAELVTREVAVLLARAMLRMHCRGRSQVAWRGVATKDGDASTQSTIAVF